MMKEYTDSLNMWHLELAMLRDVVNQLLFSMEGPEWQSSAAHICSDRFDQLVESMPFPAAAVTE